MFLEEQLAIWQTQKIVKKVKPTKKAKRPIFQKGKGHETLARVSIDNVDIMAMEIFGSKTLKPLIRLCLRGLAETLEAVGLEVRLETLVAVGFEVCLETVETVSIAGSWLEPVVAVVKARSGNP